MFTILVNIFLYRFCVLDTTWQVSPPIYRKWLRAGTRVSKAAAREGGGVNVCSTVSTLEPR
jgi:hypothetical protein